MKYLVTNESKMFHGVKLYRIKALKSFANISKGDLGGFIQSVDNLSQSGNTWVYGNARVSGDEWDKSPLQIQGTVHFFNMRDKNHIIIGCHSKTIKQWKRIYSKIGKMEGYTPDQIKEYKLYIDLAEKLYEV